MSQIYVAGFSARELPGQYLDVVSTGRYLLLPYPCAQLYLYKDGPGFFHPKVSSSASIGLVDAAELAAVDTIDTWRQWVVMWHATPGEHRLQVRETDGAGQTRRTNAPTRSRTGDGPSPVVVRVV